MCCVWLKMLDSLIHKTQNVAVQTGKSKPKNRRSPKIPRQMNLSTWVLAGLSVQSPLKAALTGLELLLARAQIWEESAAKHVSLGAELEGVAALATRWRRLELAAWRNLLNTTRSRHAAGQLSLPVADACIGCLHLVLACINLHCGLLWTLR